GCGTRFARGPYARPEGPAPAGSPTRARYVQSLASERRSRASLLFDLKHASWLVSENCVPQRDRCAHRDLTARHSGRDTRPDSQWTFCHERTSDHPRTNWESAYNVPPGRLAIVEQDRGRFRPALA